MNRHAARPSEPITEGRRLGGEITGFHRPELDDCSLPCRLDRGFPGAGASHAGRSGPVARNPCRNRTKPGRMGWRLKRCGRRLLRRSRPRDHGDSVAFFAPATVHRDATGFVALAKTAFIDKGLWSRTADVESPRHGWWGAWRGSCSLPPGRWRALGDGGVLPGMVERCLGPPPVPDVPIRTHIPPFSSVVKPFPRGSRGARSGRNDVGRHIDRDPHPAAALTTGRG